MFANRCDATALCGTGAEEGSSREQLEEAQQALSKMDGEKGNNAISIFHSDGARDTFKHVYMRDKSHLLAVLTAVSSASPIDKIITMIGDL